MRSKWITFAVVGSLGAFARWEYSRGDEKPADAASADTALAATDAETATRQRAQDLLRKATAELGADHFAAARKLVKQAVATGAQFGVFDLRPEHVLAEIERREAGAPAADTAPATHAEHAVQLEPAPIHESALPPDKAPLEAPAAAPSPPGQVAPIQSPPVNASAGQPAAAKLLDGVFEPVPTEAADQAQLTPPPIPQQKVEPRPGNSNAADSNTSAKAKAILLLDRGLLALDEQRFDEAQRLAEQAAQLHVVWGQYDYRPQNLVDEVRAKRSIAPASPAEPKTVPISELLADDPSTSAPKSPVASAASAPIAPPVAAPAPKVLTPAPAGSMPAEISLSQQAPVVQAKPAEALLEQALGDLRAGHDGIAHQKVAQALQLMGGTQQSAANFPAAASNFYRPTPTIPPAAMPGMGGYPYPDAHLQGDLIKPLHDPYLGDDAAPTQSASAGEQKMRESTPQSMVAIPSERKNVTPIYLPRLGVSPPDDNQVDSADYTASTAAADPKPATASSSSVLPSGALAPKAQATPDTAALSPQMEWLQKTSAPIPPGGIPPAAPVNGSWAASGRPNSPPYTDPAANLPPDQQPGFFRKMWNAVSGQ